MEGFTNECEVILVTRDKEHFKSEIMSLASFKVSRISREHSISVSDAIKHAFELWLKRYSKRRAPRPIPRAQFAFKDLMIH
jgi:hypothetical protein